MTPQGKKIWNSKAGGELMRAMLNGEELTPDAKLALQALKALNSEARQTKNEEIIAEERKAQEQAQEDLRAQQDERKQKEEADQAELDRVTRQRAGNPDNFIFGESSRDAASLTGNLFTSTPAKKPEPAKPEQESTKKGATEQGATAIDNPTGLDSTLKLSEKEQAQKVLDFAPYDNAEFFGKIVRASMTPEQEQKVLPLLTKLMDAAFQLGYIEFKAAAKFILDTIRSRIGADVADSVTLNHLQGAYIGMAGRYKGQASTIMEVGSVTSLEEITGEDNVNDRRVFRLEGSGDFTCSSRDLI